MGSSLAACNAGKIPATTPTTMQS
ncbi:uncharacterized protein METZ01_LOCUS399144, partial [marine metagenome]